MQSIGFPNIFTNSAKTNIINDRDATISNLFLLLKSRKNTLFGDPYYGTDLIKYIYQLNNYVLVDLIKDEIYTCLIEYMPQLSLKRDDITIVLEKSNISAHINALNKLTGEYDLFNIRLIDEGEA